MEDFFNVNIFLILNVNVSINSVSFKYICAYITKNFVFIPSLGQSTISDILTFIIEMLLVKIRQIVKLLGSKQPISYHWSLLIPPENMKKPKVFWCFPGVSKDTSGMKLVNAFWFPCRFVKHRFVKYRFVRYAFRFLRYRCS